METIPTHPPSGSPPSAPESRSHFIKDIIDNDRRTGKHGGRVHTRFPPEPNGFLHIGHAKSICLNFGVAAEYGGPCNLRFDDTNPETEETSYVESIKEDVRWLGFDWEDREFYASDYFEKLYEFAVRLIKKGKAYVCDLSAEEISETRGTLTRSGKESSYRGRSIEENMDLFVRMRTGEFPDGSRVLRAKIDMAHPNLLMRDPILYRIRKATHYRTGDDWCIYPTYDWAHGQSDSIEGITHSLCTLEFEVHRPLYDWFLDALEIHHPQQIEFARLNLSHTVLSKRRLLELVRGGYVSAWDDPRMPTISGMRRRGYTPGAIRDFCDKIGVAKANSIVDMALLEDCVRRDLNRWSPRVMAVLRPLKVVIVNYPEGTRGGEEGGDGGGRKAERKEGTGKKASEADGSNAECMEELDAINNPEDLAAGTRKVPFSRVLYIEKEDFIEDPPKKFFRLALGREVRLRYAYFIKCVDVIKDEKTGEIMELHCTYDPATRGGDAPDGRKVKATLHWVSAAHAVDVEVRLYDTLFAVRDPSEVLGRGGGEEEYGENIGEKEGMSGRENAGIDESDESGKGGGEAGEGDIRERESGTKGNWKTNLNPKSLEVLRGCKVEPSLKGAAPGSRIQFERIGYFCVDTKDSTPDKLVFNRTVTLRDEWARLLRSGKHNE